MTANRSAIKCALSFSASVVLTLTLFGCSSQEANEGSVAVMPEASQQEDTQVEESDMLSNTVPTQEEPSMETAVETDGETAASQVRLLFDGGEAVVVFDGGDTANALAQRLPLTLDMSDMNGNEKFAYLDETLPTNTYAPGRIEAGDLMLYGDNCLVLFYESFDTSYSYTRIGRVEDAAVLAAIADAQNVRVSFETA